MDTNLGQKLPIDAVILWVNGNDKKHQDKILKFVKDKNLVKTTKIHKIWAVRLFIY